LIHLFIVKKNVSGIVRVFFLRQRSREYTVTYVRRSRALILNSRIIQVKLYQLFLHQADDDIRHGITVVFVQLNHLALAVAADRVQ